jgi:hypothetical protein
MRAVSLDGLMVPRGPGIPVFHSIEVANDRLAIRRGPFAFSAGASLPHRSPPSS